MIDGGRRFRVAILVHIHNDVRGIDGHIVDISDNIDLDAIAFRVLMVQARRLRCSKLQ